MAVISGLIPTWKPMRHNMCSIMDTPLTSRVHFNETQNTIHDVVPYSEMYHMHPHFIIAICGDDQCPRWKTPPARSDYFTGKSSMVMAARRKALHKIKKGARKKRKAILQAANTEPQRVQQLGDIA